MTNANFHLKVVKKRKKNMKKSFSKDYKSLGLTWKNKRQNEKKKFALDFTKKKIETKQIGEQNKQI